VDDQGLFSGRGKYLYVSLHHRVQTCSAFNPLSYQLSKVYRGPFLGGKRPGCEADHSLSSCAKAENVCEAILPLYIRLSRRDASLSTGSTLPLQYEKYQV
jgi:hypothetical protein